MVNQVLMLKIYNSFQFFHLEMMFIFYLNGTNNSELNNIKKEILMKGILFSILSGFCGSLGGLFGKLMSMTDVMIIKIAFIGLMLVMNVLGGFMFAKALNDVQSIIATIVATITSFIMSAIIGLMFGEVISMNWILGIILMIVGVGLIIYSPENNKQDNNQNEVHENVENDKSVENVVKAKDE